MKRIISIILCMLMMVTMVPVSIITTNAAMADEAENYELGTTYKGSMGYGSCWGSRYFKFKFSKKSHISLNCKSNSDLLEWRIWNSSGKIVLKNADINSNKKYSNVTGYYSSKYGKDLNKGTYFLESYSPRSEEKISFIIDAEPTVQFAKGALTSVKSPQKGQFVAKCKKCANAIGYQFQYSLNERFKSGVKTVKSFVARKTVKKLKAGKRYYVRVRPYAIYTDGTYVYGQYSSPKSVKIKKK